MKLKSVRLLPAFSDMQAVFESNLDFNCYTVISRYEEISEIFDTSVCILMYHLDVWAW